MVVSYVSEIINDVELFEKTVLSDGTVEYLVKGTPFSFTESNVAGWCAHMNGSTFVQCHFDKIDIVNHTEGTFFMLFYGQWLTCVLHKAPEN